MQNNQKNPDSNNSTEDPLTDITKTQINTTLSLTEPKKYQKITPEHRKRIFDKHVLGISFTGMARN